MSRNNPADDKLLQQVRGVLRSAYYGEASGWRVLLVLNLVEVRLNEPLTGPKAQANED